MDAGKHRYEEAADTQCLGEPRVQNAPQQAGRSAFVAASARRWLPSLVLLGTLAQLTDAAEPDAWCGLPRSTNPDMVIGRCATRPWYRLRTIERLALAQAYARAARNDDAERMAPTLAPADALHVLGHVAFNRRHFDGASRLLLRAAILHVATGSREEAARAFQMRAGAHRARNDFGNALLDAGACVRIAESVGGRLLAYCHLALARVLSEVGQADAAVEEFAIAMPLLTSDHDRAWALLERGNLHQEIERHALAALDFEAALQLSREPRVLRGAHLNAAFSYAGLGELEAAGRHLSAVEPTGPEYLAVAGRVAQARGDRALAREYLVAALHGEDVPSEVMWLAVRLAELARGDGDAASEERYLRLAIRQVESMRARERLELRPWVMAAGRRCYEHLFVRLAARGEPLAATELAARWLGRTALEARAAAMDRPRTASVARIADQVHALSRLSAVGATEFQLPPDEDVLVLVVAADQVWRILALRGVPRVERVGGLGEVLTWRARLEVDDDAAARAFGHAALPREVAYVTSRPIVVIVDPRLGWVDVGRLDCNGRSLMALRPVAYRVALTRRHEHARSAAPASFAVFGDAGSDLLGAHLEALMVASILDVAPRLGPQVTKATLLSSGSYEVVHIAGHTRFERGMAALEVADGLVTFDDIIRAPRVPRIVVLSVCSGAAASDVEGFTALTTAFLIAGSEFVVASDRSVADGDMLVAMLRFYRSRGWLDPVRAVRETRQSNDPALVGRGLPLFVFQSL